MSQQGSDRNLLLGILALQLDFIQQHQLIAAMQQWLLHKASKLEDILLEQKAIDNDKRDFLVSIVHKHLEFHGDDPRESLAALSSLSSVKKELDELGDPDVDATLAGMATDRRNPESADETHSMVGDGASQFGRYRILRPHDAGGLGQVSVAEDEELHREVALKEIKERYANDPGSRQRFLVEAEVTGRLEHPGVVPVYGLGQDSHGRPFYAMRFIRGDSLKERLNRFHSVGKGPQTPESRNHELRKLLRRFTDVCNAIEYAHSRGVLHRDLKPGNIMLGKYGETLVVDWGLAKTVEKTGTHEHSDEPTFLPSSGDGSSKTRMGSVVGTPKYMSPEQAEGRVDAMGPATDVYCLGATLYCILTGQPPFTTGSTEEIIAAVRKGDFRTPSSVRSDVPPALEAICLKAMALQQSDRYPTAASLAEEAELWLADEPVSVYREPWADRVGRFLRKHRTLVVSGTVLMTTVVIALAVINGLVTNQNKELRVARNRAEDSRIQAVQASERAEQSRKVAIEERDRAEKNLTTARSIALNIVEIAEQRLSNVPGLEGFRETMMDRTYHMFEEIYEEVPETSGLQRELSQIARMSGNLKRALRKMDVAETRIERSIDLQERLCADNPGDGSLLDYLAETHRDLATLLKAADRLSEADATLQRATEIIAQLLKEEDDNLNYQRTRATIELERISLQTDLLDLASALELSVRCSNTFKVLVETDNHDQDVSCLLLAMARRGQLLDRLQRGSEARKVFEDAVELSRSQLAENPDPLTKYAIARVLYWSGEGSMREGTVTDDARDRVGEALEMWKSLTALSPKTTAFQYYLGDAWRVRGGMHALEQQTDQADAAFQQAESVLELLLETANEANYQAVLAQTLTDWAEFKQTIGDQGDAVRLLGRAVTLRQEACDLAPASKDLREKLTQLQRTLEEAKNSNRSG